MAVTKDEMIAFLTELEAIPMWTYKPPPKADVWYAEDEVKAVADDAEKMALEDDSDEDEVIADRGQVLDDLAEEKEESGAPRSGEFFSLLDQLRSVPPVDLEAWPDVQFPGVCPYAETLARLLLLLRRKDASGLTTGQRLCRQSVFDVLLVDYYLPVDVLPVLEKLERTRAVLWNLLPRVKEEANLRLYPTLQKQLKTAARALLSNLRIADLSLFWNTTVRRPEYMVTPRAIHLEWWWWVMQCDRRLHPVSGAVQWKQKLSAREVKVLADSKLAQLERTFFGPVSESSKEFFRPFAKRVAENRLLCVVDSETAPNLAGLCRAQETFVVEGRLPTPDVQQMVLQALLDEVGGMMPSAFGDPDLEDLSLVYDEDQQYPHTSRSLFKAWNQNKMASDIRERKHESDPAKVATSTWKAWDDAELHLHVWGLIGDSDGALENVLQEQAEAKAVDEDYNAKARVVLGAVTAPVVHSKIVPTSLRFPVSVQSVLYETLPLTMPGVVRQLLEATAPAGRSAHLLSEAKLRLHDLSVAADGNKPRLRLWQVELNTAGRISLPYLSEVPCALHVAVGAYLVYSWDAIEAERFAGWPDRERVVPYINRLEPLAYKGDFSDIHALAVLRRFGDADVLLPSMRACVVSAGETLVLPRANSGYVFIALGALNVLVTRPLLIQQTVEPAVLRWCIPAHPDMPAFSPRSFDEDTLEDIHRAAQWLKAVYTGRGFNVLKYLREHGEERFPRTAGVPWGLDTFKRLCDSSMKDQLSGAPPTYRYAEYIHMPSAALRDPRWIDDPVLYPDGRPGSEAAKSYKGPVVAVIRGAWNGEAEACLQAVAQPALLTLLLKVAKLDKEGIECVIKTSVPTLGLWISTQSKQATYKGWPLYGKELIIARKQSATDVGEPTLDPSLIIARFIYTLRTPVGWESIYGGQDFGLTPRHLICTAGEDWLYRIVAQARVRQVWDKERHWTHKALLQSTLEDLLDPDEEGIQLRLPSEISDIFDNDRLTKDALRLHVSKLQGRPPVEDAIEWQYVWSFIEQVDENPLPVLETEFRAMREHNDGDLQNRLQRFGPVDADGDEIDLVFDVAVKALSDGADGLADAIAGLKISDEPALAPVRAVVDALLDTSDASDVALSETDADQLDLIMRRLTHFYKNTPLDDEARVELQRMELALFSRFVEFANIRIERVAEAGDDDAE